MSTHRVWIAISLLGALVACAPAPEPANPATQPQGPTRDLTLESRGGLCPGDENAGGLCLWTLTIRSDGTWQRWGHDEADRAGGAISAELAGEIIDLADAGWDSMTAEPFTGDCPAAVDGHEQMLTIRWLPDDPAADAAVEQSSSCQHDWSSAAAAGVLYDLAERLGDAGLRSVFDE